MNTTLVSIVVPAHNEEDGLDGAIREICRVLGTCGVEYEVIVVDDGSKDATFESIKTVGSAIPEVKGIRLSRNFGKEGALLAGLRAARGNAVITMDADLQHPPTVIPEMIRKWRQGAKVVHGVKRRRGKDSLVVRLRAALFNDLLKLLGGVDLRDSSDFKLLDRSAVESIVQGLLERKRFYRGLAKWVGFTQEDVFFDVAPREVGEGKWSVRSLIGFAITGVVSFTSAPLRIVTVLGVITLVLAIVVIAEAIWSWFQGTAVSGFVTIIITLLITGSFVMISLGILGEYVAKIYEEVKGRPSFLVDSTSGFDEADDE